MYGKDKPQPPLASAEKPHSVVEKETYYVFDFRKPFGPLVGRQKDFAFMLEYRPADPLPANDVKFHCKQTD